MDWIDKEKQQRDLEINRPLDQLQHATVNTLNPGRTPEYCCECFESFQEVNALLKERRTYIETLVRLASFSDTGAQRYLDGTGSYSAFDNPGSVRLAREALERGINIVKNKNSNRDLGATGYARAQASQPEKK